MANAGPATSVPDTEHQFNLLFDLIQQINQGAGLERVFELVANTLREIFAIDRFALVLLRPDGSLSLTATHGLSERYLRRVRDHMTTSPGARALAARRPLYIEDATGPDFAPLQEAASDEGLRTVLILPLFAGPTALGYLLMYHDVPRSYTPAEVILAQALAQQAALAVQHARMLDAAEAHRADLERRFNQRVMEAEAIDEITLGIASSLDLEQTLQAITDAAASLSPAATASLYLREPDGTFRAVAAHGTPLDRLQSVVLTPSTGLLKEICRTGRPAQVSDFAAEVVSTDAAYAEVRRTGVHATLGVPFMENGVCIGVLYAGSVNAEPFPPDTIRGMTRLATFARVAVRNARRFSDVEAERFRLQAYLDAIPEGVLILERNGRIALVNEALQRQVGASVPLEGLSQQQYVATPERFSTRPIRFRYDPQAVFIRVITTGKPEQGLLEVGDPPQTYEVHFNALRSPAGSIEGVVATVREITELLELERERSRMGLLAQLLDLSVVLNSDLSIPVLLERVVEVAMELVGAESGTLGLVEGDRLAFRRFHLPDRWIDFDVSLLRGQGGPGYVWETMAPYVSNDCSTDPRVLADVQHSLGFRRMAAVPVINREGKLIGTLSVYDPVVERDFGQRDVEALQLLAHQVSIAIENARLSETKDAFLSIVSHELKTPVTSIKGFTQVLQRRLPDEVMGTAGKYLSVINQQTDRLTTLINDLLDLSRIQLGRFYFDLEPVDYARLVREVVEEMELVTPHNPLVLTAPDRVMVQANANRLRQVLVNLIDNAVKYGPEGEPIQVTVEAGDTVAVTTVVDNGRGLPAAEAERVFNPYYQLVEGGPQHATGLGLGLYISRQIVTEHGGEIGVEAGEQTCFRFTIPLDQGAEPA